LRTPKVESSPSKTSQICKISFGSKIQVATEQSLAYPNHPSVTLKCEEILTAHQMIKKDTSEPEEQTDIVTPNPIIVSSTLEVANVKPEPPLDIVDRETIIGNRNQPTSRVEHCSVTRQDFLEVESTEQSIVEVDNNYDVIQIDDSEEEDVVQFVGSVKVDKAKVEKVRKQKLLERQNKFKSRLKEKAKAYCQCKVCGKQYCNPAALKQHKRRHTRALSEHDNPFQCQLCFKKFVKKQSLNRHLDYTHERKKPCYCKHCGKTFRAKYFLNIHTIEEHPNEDIIID